MRLLLLPGDGIGPEIVSATARVVEAASDAFGLDLTLEERPIGFEALKAAGTTMPEEVLETVRAVDGVIMGPVSHNAYPPRSEGGLNPSAILRSGLDLYANVRPARTRAAAQAWRCNWLISPAISKCPALPLSAPALRDTSPAVSPPPRATKHRPFTR